MKRPAFTMLELVFAIVVLGILAIFAMPRLDRDRVQEAADAVLSNIRYTQHLALLDNKQKFDDEEWQREFWRIEFESCNGSGLFFSIGSDTSHAGGLAKAETALDPANGKPLFWKNTSSCTNGGDGTVSENIFLSKKFGVASVAGTGGCNGIKYIGFDHLGRPHTVFSTSAVPNNSSYMRAVCTFTFTMENSDTFAVTIQPETGYAQIAGQPNS